MGRYLPRVKFVAGEIADVDQLNDNLQEAHSTLAALNEHNFDASCLDNAEANWATDIGLTLTYNEVSIDPQGVSGEVLESSGQWAPVPGGEVTIATRGGKCWVVASFQILTPKNDTTGREPGVMFALEIDGAVDHGALIGSADLSNDMVQQSILPSGAFFPGIDNDTGPGLRGGFIPVVLEKVVTLGEGVHIIRVVSRNLQPFHFVAQEVSQMLLAAFDMWA